MRSLLAVGCVATIALLAASPGACAPKQEPAAAPEKIHAPHPEQSLSLAREQALMRIIFPGEQEHEDKVGFHILHPEPEDQYHLMTFASAREFPDGRLVVVVHGSPADAKGLTLENGVDTASAYVLRRRGDTWAVDERHEHIARTGTFGSPGDVKWATLGPGKEGFIVSGKYYATDFTEYSGSAQVFAFDDRSLSHLGRIPDFVAYKQRCSPNDSPCMNVKGLPRLADTLDARPYYDLLFDFTGRRFSANAGGPGKKAEKVPATIRTTARYRHDGQGYVLVSGTNPIAE